MTSLQVTTAHVLRLHASFWRGRDCSDDPGYVTSRFQEEQCAREPGRKRELNQALPPTEGWRASPYEMTFLPCLLFFVSNSDGLQPTLMASNLLANATTRTLLGAPGRTTRNKDATNGGSWHRDSNGAFGSLVRRACDVRSDA